MVSSCYSLAEEEFVTLCLWGEKARLQHKRMRIGDYKHALFEGGIQSLAKEKLVSHSLFMDKRQNSAQINECVRL